MDFSLCSAPPHLPSPRFAPREARVLGHGWQVNRVRENSWAEQQGVLAGDELHCSSAKPRCWWFWNNFEITFIYGSTELYIFHHRVVGIMKNGDSI